jgi:NAD(P)-dependent dehydrogenase (short-subunit alcohol dehydrogenase family)
MTVGSDIKRVVEEAVKKSRRIDILANNAGIMRFGKLEGVSPSLWDGLVNVNAPGPWRLMVFVLPEMRKVAGRSIVNISSTAGIRAFSGSGLCGAAKAVLQKFSQVLAMEVASENIGVNVICPGMVEDTELNDTIVGKENVHKRYDQWRPLHPLQRDGKPKNIADAALFLATDQSSWITGIILNVDGGSSSCNKQASYLKDLIDVYHWRLKYIWN